MKNTFLRWSYLCHLSTKKFCVVHLRRKGISGPLREQSYTEIPFLETTIFCRVQRLFLMESSFMNWKESESKKLSLLSTRTKLFLISLPNSQMQKDTCMLWALNLQPEIKHATMQPNKSTHIWEYRMQTLQWMLKFNPEHSPDLSLKVS